MRRNGFSLFDAVFIIAMVVLGFGVGYWLTGGNILWSLLAALLSLIISAFDTLRAKRSGRLRR